MLTRLHHPIPPKPQHATADCTTPACGQKHQHALPKPEVKQLSPKEIKRLQEIVGACRCYCDLTDPMPLVALGRLVS